MNLKTVFPASGWLTARFMLFALLFLVAVSAQQVDSAFGHRAKAHVAALAALGPRPAGTAADRKAEAYIARQMRRAGLEVSVETFEFDSFRLSGVELVATGTSNEVEHVIFDPYQGPLEVTGAPLFVLAANVRPTDVFLQSTQGRILIAGPQLTPHRLAFHGPKAAVIVSQQTFDRLRALAPSEVTLRVRGNLERVRTSNIVGKSGRDGAPFTMFVAHRDSTETAPGADDNASGVAVLLELGRAWNRARATRPVRFVALAAEEVGLVGAKAYIARHRDELKGCALVFNMDSIGADADTETWLDANGGVQGIERDWTPLCQAQVGPGELWMAPEPFVPASNVPVRLREAILTSAKETGIRVNLGQFSSSDHLVFARVGVPATNLAAGTGKGHTKEDVAANVSEKALARAGRLAIAVATKAN